MNIDDYQEVARSTAIYPNEDITGIIYTALGLTGEAGEVSEKIKKHLRDGGDLPYDAIAKELGDVLWYVANLAQEIGFSLSEIAQMNLDKLLSRKKRGVIGGSGDNR